MDRATISSAVDSLAVVTADPPVTRTALVLGKRLSDASRRLVGITGLAVAFAGGAAPFTESRVANAAVRLEDPAFGPAFERGGGSGARAVFASRRQPRTGEEWYDRARSLHDDERWDEAIEAFRKAMDLGYREETAAYNIACGYARKRDADRAFEWLGKAMDLGFAAHSYLDSDDDLDSLQSDPRMTDLKRKAKTRKAEKKRGDATAQLARVEALLANPGQDGSGLFAAGKRLLDMGEYDGAARAFLGAAERGHREGTSLYNAACSLARKGDKVAALDTLHRSLEAGYDDPKHLDRDDDLDAIRNEPRFEELKRLADELKLPAGNIFGGYLELGQSVDARKAAVRYRNHLKAHPGCGRAHANLGYVALRLDELEAARDAFLKAVEAGHRKPTMMYNLACSYARLGQKDAAFEWLFKAMDAGLDVRSLLENDDDLDKLRGDPRFRKAKRQAAER